MFFYCERSKVNEKKIYGLLIAIIMVLGLCGCDFLKEKGDGDIVTDRNEAILYFLDCNYELIPNKGNPKAIIDRYNALAEQGKTDGFFPLIIIPSDILIESLELFLEYNNIENTQESIASYRQRVIDMSNEIDAVAFLSSQIDKTLALYNSAGFDIFGQFVQPNPQNALTLHMLEYESCEAVIIAKIPTQNPWELAAWIPMGGFNECPMPAEQVAIFRYWYEKYGAVPAAVTYDTWQMILTRPPLTEEEAEALAKEHFAFCPDTVLQGAETIRGLASTLKDSSAWFFWWD